MLSTRYLAIYFAMSLMATCTAFSQDKYWLAAFEASPTNFTVPIPPAALAKFPFLAKHEETSGTFRVRFALSTGGDRIRIRLSNELSPASLSLCGASIALAAEGANANPATIHRLLFQGQPRVSVPASSALLSDPVDMPVKALGELVFSACVDEKLTIQPINGTVQLRSEGDQVMSPSLISSSEVKITDLLSAAYVEQSKPLPLIVALGDSISDPRRDHFDKPHGWVHQLNLRLANNPKVIVISAGIGGNRVLRDGSGPSALARVDRDVFSLSGLKSMILLEGINDIGSSGASAFGVEPTVTADELIAGYQQLAARAHVRGIRIFGGTMPPFRGAMAFSEEKEKVRLAVNTWIRTTRDFDAVIDFDKALRDPNAPDTLAKQFDSGDHLHPGESGYEAMSAAVPLELLR